MAASSCKNPYTNFANNFNHMDFNAFGGMIGKNMEAVTAANQVWMEGMQIASKRQIEVAKQSAQKGFDCFKQCATNHDLHHAHQAHSDWLQELVSNSANNGRELLELSSKAALEMFDILSRRASEFVQEVSSTCKPQKAEK